MLTRKQHELLTFIDKHLKATGFSPSFEEMKEALQLRSKSGIHRLISALEERGFLRRRHHRARALEVVRLPNEVRARDRVAARCRPGRRGRGPCVLPRTSYAATFPAACPACAPPTRRLPCSCRCTGGLPRACPLRRCATLVRARRGAGRASRERGALRLGSRRRLDGRGRYPGRGHRRDPQG